MASVFSDESEVLLESLDEAEESGDGSDGASDSGSLHESTVSVTSSVESVTEELVESALSVVPDDVSFCSVDSVASASGALSFPPPQAQRSDTDKSNAMINENSLLVMS